VNFRESDTGEFRRMLILGTGVNKDIMKCTNGGYRILVVGKQPKVQLTAWNRFDTSNLTVAPELLGRSHAFTFDGHGIDVSLPSAERIPDEELRGMFVGERLMVSGWLRGQDGRRRPIDFHIKDVDVVIDIPGKTSVPEEARTGSVNHALFSEQQQKRLGNLADWYGSVARQAFDLWIRTLRWKADDFWIGSPAAIVVVTGSRTELRERGTPNRLWKSGEHITVHVEKTVTSEIWNEVSATLLSGLEPPIFYDLLYDAMAQLVRGDLRRAVVDAAVAAETCMRTMVQEGLPDSLDEVFRTYIDEANISQVIRRFFSTHLDDQQSRAYKGLSSDLYKLFDARNAIMHSGRTDNLTTQKCQRLINRVRDLLALVPHEGTLREPRKDR
jgi:hypothetical protein